MNALVHDVRVADRIVVEEVDQLISALKFFGDDLPLDKTYCCELMIETLSDGNEVSSLRFREAERV